MKTSLSREACHCLGNKGLLSPAIRSSDGETELSSVPLFPAPGNSINVLGGGRQARTERVYNQQILTIGILKGCTCGRRKMIPEGKSGMKEEMVGTFKRLTIYKQ